ncbi:MAG: hypothetical protein VXV96_13000 [Bdellovibrionota bacterium]|nr:hypothetical protein [Bdellovibrionota bacterium]
MKILLFILVTLSCQAEDSAVNNLSVESKEERVKEVLPQKTEALYQVRYETVIRQQIKAIKEREDKSPQKI